MNKGLMKCQGLKKAFGARQIFDGLDFEVNEGEFFALLGPSGIGKTTLLRCLSGLDEFEEGEVLINGESLIGLPANKRPIGLMFQEAALFPHMTVGENIAYGLREVDDSEVRVKELLKLISLSGYGDKHPSTLSMGQQQRVALARALAAEPEIVLFDEPFASLDENLRISLRIELKDILKKAGQTAIFVTHDREEAMSVADRIAVMIDGQILQIGDPENVYLYPVDKRVALFLGYANYLPGKLDGDGCLQTELGEFEVKGREFEIKDSSQKMSDREVFFRPESLVLEKDDSVDHKVKRIEYFGHDLLIDVRTAEGHILHARLLGPENEFKVGDGVSLFVKEPYFVL